MKVLVTGAAGMLGRDVMLAAGNAGHDVVGFGRAELDVTDAAAAGEEARARAPDCRHQLRRLDRRRRRRGRRAGGASRSTAPAPATSPPRRRRSAPASSTSPATTSSTAQGRPLRGERPGRPALRLRPHQARRRGGDHRRQQAPLRRPLVLAVRHRRPQLRRDDAAPGRSGGEVLVVRDQVGSPTYTWHLAYGIVRLIEGIEFGIHHMAAAGQCSWYEFAREIFEQAKVECKVLSVDHRECRPPGTAAALLGAGQPARARDRAALLAGRAGRLPRPATSERSQHEDPRNRRRRVHRLHLRPAGRRRARGHGARQAHLRRPAARTCPRAIELIVGAIEDPAVVREAMEGVDAVVNFAAESHVDRSIDDQDAFARTHVIGTGTLLDAARELGVRPLPAGLHRRGLRLDRVRLLHRDLAAGPLLALLGDQGGRRPAGLRPRPHLRHRGLDRARLQQLRPAPVPGEADPADRAERDPRRPAARLRRRPPGPQLALRRGLLPRHPRGADEAAGRARPTTSAAPTSARTSRW